MTDDNAEPADTDAPPPPAPPDPVRRWTLITLSIIGLLLVWYLAADRLTPFSSQARVDTYVIPLAPQVSAQILAVNVSNNQRVEQGDILLQLDDTQYRLAVDRAAADLEAAEQEVGASSAGVASAAARVDAAKAELVRSQKDFNRMQRIRQEDPGAVSQRRLDLAEASLAAARSKVASSEAELEKARQQLGREGLDNARLQAARAALENAELELSRTRVRAPSNGLVTDLQVDIGNLATPGQPLMTFVAIYDVWVQADMRENNLGNLMVGDPVDIAFDVQPGRVFSGRVRSIGYGVDAGTQTALGKLPTIDNDRNWLREAQRFPVIVELDTEALQEPIGLRVGAQATVIAYTEGGWLLKPLGKLYIRLASLLSYAY